MDTEDHADEMQIEVLAALPPAIWVLRSPSLVNTAEADANELYAAADLWEMDALNEGSTERVYFLESMVWRARWLAERLGS